MLLNCGVGEDSWEPLGLQGDPTSPSYRRSVLNIHWKDWCWSWNSNPLATWCGEQTHWKRPWFQERLKAGGEVDDRGWDGWMASPTRWTWVWVNSGNWWWTGRPGVLQFMGLQRVGHDWATELSTRDVTCNMINIINTTVCMFIKLDLVPRVLIMRRTFFFSDSLIVHLYEVMGFLGGKEPVCQCRRHTRCGFNPWVRKIPWRRAWQPTPVFLPEESNRQRSLAGQSP